MSKTTRRERRAPDPSAPTPRAIGAYCLVTAEGTINAPGPLLLCNVGNTWTGVTMVDAPPLIIEPFDVDQIYYQLSGGAVKKFVSGNVDTSNKIALHTVDPDWIDLAEGVLFSPVWHDDIRGPRGLMLAPFRLPFVVTTL